MANKPHCKSVVWLKLPPLYIVNNFKLVIKGIVNTPDPDVKTVRVVRSWNCDMDLLRLLLLSKIVPDPQSFNFINKNLLKFIMSAYFYTGWLFIIIKK